MQDDGTTVWVSDPRAGVESHSPGAAINVARTALDLAHLRPVNVYLGGSSTADARGASDGLDIATRLLQALQGAHPSGGTESDVQVDSRDPLTGHGVHLYRHGRGGLRARDYNPAPAINALGADIAVHMIGANDLALDALPASGYEAIMRAMVDASTRPGLVHILVNQHPIDYIGDADWEGYADALRRVADSRPGRVAAVDASAAFMARRRGGDTSWYAPDGVHLNDIGHAMLAGEIARALT